MIRPTQFRVLQDREAVVAGDVDGLHPSELIPKCSKTLSGNAKTSVSLDFPIGQTCAPTKLCAMVCYASRPGTPAGWNKSLRKRLRNLRFYREMPTRVSVARLVREFDSLRASWAARGVDLDYLRVNGTGDLFPEIIPVLNAFMVTRSAVRLWVVSRQFGLAARLDHAPNLFLQLSVDRTTSAADLLAARVLVAANPRAYLSFLRAGAGEDALGAAIVFHEKRTEGLGFVNKTDCPADAGRIELDNVRGKGGTACSRCRKCFSEPTLARQRAA